MNDKWKSNFVNEIIGSMFSAGIIKIVYESDEIVINLKQNQVELLSIILSELMIDESNVSKKMVYNGWQVTISGKNVVQKWFEKANGYVCGITNVHEFKRYCEKIGIWYINSVVTETSSVWFASYFEWCGNIRLTKSAHYDRIVVNHDVLFITNDNSIITWINEKYKGGFRPTNKSMNSLYNEWFMCQGGKIVTMYNDMVNIKNLWNYTKLGKMCDMLNLYWTNGSSIANLQTNKVAYKKYVQLFDEITNKKFDEIIVGKNRSSYKQGKSKK